jgi:hypothetical protein
VPATLHNVFQHRVIQELCNQEVDIRYIVPSLKGFGSADCKIPRPQ